MLPVSCDAASLHCQWQDMQLQYFARSETKQSAVVDSQLGCRAMTKPCMPCSMGVWAHDFMSSLRAPYLSRLWRSLRRPSQALIRQYCILWLCSTFKFIRWRKPCRIVATGVHQAVSEHSPTERVAALAKMQARVDPGMPPSSISPEVRPSASPVHVPRSGCSAMPRNDGFAEEPPVPVPHRRGAESPMLCM